MRLVSKEKDEGFACSEALRDSTATMLIDTLNQQKETIPDSDVEPRRFEISLQQL